MEEPFKETLNTRIKFRHMQCFLAILQLGSVQRAADSLALTQPAVSKTIAELEGIVGTRLFERGRGGAVPTRQGQLFAPHARACLDALRAGVDELQRHDAPARLAIGALPTVAAALLAPALAAFRAQWPDISVHLDTGANQRLLEGLQAGEFAFAIGRLSDSKGMAGLSFEQLYRDPLAVAVRAGHPLLGATQPTAAQLAQYLVVVPPVGTLIRQSADNVLTAFGAQASTALVETLSISLGRNLAMQHDSVWFVPQSAVELDLADGLLALLRMPLSGTDEPIGLVRRIGAAADPITEALVQAVRESAGRQHQAGGVTRA